VVRHRRNNSVAGVLLLVAAMLIGASAVLPWIHFHGPTVNAEAVSLSTGYDYTPGVDADDGDVTRAVIVGFAIALAVCALLLIVTRLRGWGIVWRILGLLVLTGPAIMTWYVWSTVLSDPAGFLAQSESVSDQLLRAGLTLGQSVGLVSAGPGSGLWAFSVGVCLGVIAIVIPAIRSSYVVPGYEPVGMVRPGGPTGRPSESGPTNMPPSIPPGSSWS
jgi:hypothetical protein